MERAAADYHSDTRRWPLDDGQSTFLYKLMGGGKRAPYLRQRWNVYDTCEVYYIDIPGPGPPGRRRQGALFAGRRPILLTWASNGEAYR